MRILFVTATRVGDSIMSTGILDRLLDENPGAKVTVACGPGAAQLFTEVPGLERLIRLEKKPYSMHWLGLWTACVGRLWDVVIDLRNAPLTYLIPTKRAHHVSRGRRDRVPGHRVKELAEAAGMTGEPPAPRIWISDRHREKARDLVPDGPPVLALGPTANWPVKQWPQERFGELAERLTGPDGILPGARIALIGNGDERDGVIPLIESIPAERFVDLVWDVDLLTVSACMERMALYVGNDSGLMHLSAATGLPTLGLFGPTPVTEYAPWGAHCDAVAISENYHEVFPEGFDHRSTETLMSDLSVDQVEAAARTLWARAGGEEVN